MYFTQTTITEGFEYKLAEAIRKAIKSNSEDSLNVIFDFIKNVIDDSANNDINLFRIYKSFPSFIFKISKKENKLPRIIDGLSKALVDCICYRLIIAIKDAKNIKEVNAINSFIQLGYIGYSQLIKETIDFRDEKSFKTAIENLTVREYLLNNKNDEYENLPLDLKKESTIFDNQDKFKDEIQLLKQSSNSYRRLKFAIFAWVCHLYKYNVFSLEDANKFLVNLKFEYEEPDDLISDLLFYNSYEFEIYDWHNWDIEDRKELEVYNPIQPNEWLTFGFVIYTLKYNELNGFNQSKFNTNEMFRWLPQKIKDNFNYILKDMEKWGKFIGSEEILEKMPDGVKSNIENKRETILKPFYVLKNKLEREETNIISSQSLSPHKVDEFKKKFFEMFINNTVFLKVLKMYNNIRQSKTQLDSINKIKPSFDLNFIRAKIMFVETKHRHIYGTEEFGGKMARELDSLIFKKLLDTKEIIEYPNITYGFENSIKLLNSKGITPNVIFIDFKLTFNFYKFEGFIPNWNNNENNFRYLIGEYKGLKVFTTHCTNLKDSFVVCDFENTIQATEFISENFHENILDINVTAIDDKIADEIYKKEIDKWRKSEDGIILSELESKELIKLNVKITSSYEMNIDNINPDSFVIGKINKEIISNPE